MLTDLPAYAEWNPFITEADGAVVVGERLWVRVPPVNAFVASTPRPTVVEWSPVDGCGCGAAGQARLPGLFHVELTWTIRDQDDGVRLWHQDQFGGLLAPLLFGSLNRHRLTSFNAMNAALKRRVEGT